MAQHRGNDAGIGGDLGRYLQATLGDQVRVVVDIPVEHSGDVRDVAAIRPSDVRDVAAIRPSDMRFVLAIGRPRIERVGIGHRDDADAGPAGVRQHHGFGTVGAQRPAQQAVLADLRSQCSRIVAQFADLRSGLVDECQPVGRIPDSAGTKERIVHSPGLRAGSAADSAGIQPCAPHEHLQTGRVAPSNLQPVECRQSDLDRPEPLHSRWRRRTAPQIGNLPGHPQAIAPHGEGVVLQLPQARVDALELALCGMSVSSVGAIKSDAQQLSGLDRAVDIGDVRVHSLQRSFDVEHAFGIGDQQADARQRSQRLIGPPQRVRSGLDQVDEGAAGPGIGLTGGKRIGKQRRGAMQERDNIRCLQRLGVVAAADDGHDPAHTSEGTEHLAAISPAQGHGRRVFGLRD